jgi:hypothetical protein
MAELISKPVRPSKGRRRRLFHRAQLPTPTDQCDSLQARPWTRAPCTATCRHAGCVPKVTGTWWILECPTCLEAKIEN